MRRSYAIWREGMMTGVILGMLAGITIGYLMCNGGNW